MKRMLMLATTAAMIEQFNKNNILILEELGYEVHVAGNWEEGNPISDERLNDFKQWIEVHGGKYFHIPAVRQPFAIKANITAYKTVVGLIREYKYEFIHCHTPIGAVIGRIAAHVTRTKIMYTAHGFHFYTGAPLKNWLLYYPVEKFLSRWTDILILINQEDYQRAKKSFHAKRTEYVPGVGVDIKKFASDVINREEKRRSIGVKESDIMLLSVGELIPRKNHGVVIEALAALRDPRLKYYICGKGDLLEVYKRQIQELGLEDQVFLLGFRNDISELCHAADIYIFPSSQEGLSLALMEAIACKVPVICSDIRGNCDLIQNRECLFQIGDKERLVQCINNACDIDGVDQKFKHTEVENYVKLQKYDLEYVMKKMSQLYGCF